MTGSLPSGDGTVDSTSPGSVADDAAAPATGLEPDTAPDAAGADPAGDDAAGQDAAGQNEEDAPRPPGPELTELTGPAESNDKMRLGTEDLRSSERKTAEAKEIAADLTSLTRPGESSA